MTSESDQSDRPGLASDILAEIAGVGPIRTPVALVVAHPDDECIAMAGTMTRFERLTIAHVTDGAPRTVDPSSGFASRDDLARTRLAELDAALRAALARPVRKIRYGLVDGEVLERLDELIDRLAADLMFSEVVITHAFEGGHIDHDSCSLAVSCACARLLQITGKAPRRLEFAGYYGQRGRVRAAQFSPYAGCEEIHLDLSPSAVRRREMAFACHRSQEGNLRYFSLIKEGFRTAPDYDFHRPPEAPLYGALECNRFRERVVTLAPND